MTETEIRIVYDTESRTVHDIRMEEIAELRFDSEQVFDQIELIRQHIPINGYIELISGLSTIEKAIYVAERLISDETQYEEMINVAYDSYNMVVDGVK